MAFSTILDKKAARELLKLERSVRERIVRKLKDCEGDPRRFFEGLESREDFKLRVGDYRVVADIDYELKTITVTKVGHRKNVYESN